MISGVSNLLHKTKVKLFEPREPITDLLTVLEVDFLLQEISCDTAQALCSLDAVGKRANSGHVHVETRVMTMRGC